MVQVWGCDDILSLRNFICILITFWSSQGNLSSKKSRKTEEKAKRPKRVTIQTKRVTIPQGQNIHSTLGKSYHDDQNVTRFWKL